jgi:Tfp pilus assembly protein PilX
MLNLQTKRISMLIPIQSNPNRRMRTSHGVAPSTLARRAHQSGVVLITVALFLVVLAALGAASMRSASVQERIAGVFYDRAVALAAADAALSDGMEYLLDSNFDPWATSSRVRDGTLLYATTTADGLSVKSWVESNFNWLTGADVLRLGAADANADLLQRVKVGFSPGYVVDRFPNMGITTTTTYQVFRVTARGNGGRTENSIYTHLLTRIPTTSGN